MAPNIVALMPMKARCCSTQSKMRRCCLPQLVPRAGGGKCARRRHRGELSAHAALAARLLLPWRGGRYALPACHCAVQVANATMWFSRLQAHSERVPNKNFRLLAGRPLYCWTLSALLGSSQIARIVIDTDADAEKLAHEIAVQFPEDAERVTVRAHTGTRAYGHTASSNPSGRTGLRALRAHGPVPTGLAPSGGSLRCTVARGSETEHRTDPSASAGASGGHGADDVDSCSRRLDADS